MQLPLEGIFIMNSQRRIYLEIKQKYVEDIRPLKSGILTLKNNLTQQSFPVQYVGFGSLPSNRLSIVVTTEENGSQSIWQNTGQQFNWQLSVNEV